MLPPHCHVLKEISVRNEKKNDLIIAITDLKHSKADGQEDAFTVIFPTFPLLFKTHLHF